MLESVHAHHTVGNGPCCFTTHCLLVSLARGIRVLFPLLPQRFGRVVVSVRSTWDWRQPGTGKSEDKAKAAP
jgi:hypothetical protein